MRPLPVAAAFDLFDRFMLLHDEFVEKDIATEMAPRVSRRRRALGPGSEPQRRRRALRAGAACARARRRQCRAAAATASLVARAVLQAVEGRPNDIERRAGSRGSLSRWSVRRRSAALTGAALETGALIAGAADPICRGFNRAGRLLPAAAGSGDARLAERLAEKALASIERCISDQRQLDAFKGLARHVATHAA